MKALLITIFLFLSINLGNGSNTNKVTVAWDAGPSTNVFYRVYYGSASRIYTFQTDAGTNSNKIVSNLVSSTTNYFTVTAYDSLGLESVFSDEVVYIVPAVVTNSPPLPPKNVRVTLLN